MNENIYDKNIVEFVTVGVEFCSFIEQASETSRNAFTDTAIKILPLLYLKATLLPDYESKSDLSVEHFVTENIYEYIRSSISRMFGEHDSYLEVFQADMQYSETPIIANISEDISDIYQDIKDFISIYSLGNEEATQEALAYCKENFISYWGQKLVNVLRALHNLHFSQNEDENDNDNVINYQNENKHDFLTQQQNIWREEMDSDEWNKWNE